MKICSSPSQLQKFEAEANQNGRLFKGKELDEEKMEAQPDVHKALVQEENELEQYGTSLDVQHCNIRKKVPLF